MSLLESKYLTQQTAFLVALTTARRAGKLRAFAASDLRIQIWIPSKEVKHDSKDYLKSLRTVNDINPKRLNTNNPKRL